MRITYDPVADAVYIYLGDPSAEVTTQEVDEDVNLDLDEHGQVVGIEVLNARARVFRGGAMNVELEQPLPQPQSA